MKKALIISLLFNLLAAGAIAFIFNRLHGWRYAWYRFSTGEEGLYFNRKNMFERLPERPGSIVFLGDSQIEQCEWREIFPDSIQILNRGIVGDHVAGVAERLPEILKNRPAKIVLCVGVNDLLFAKSADEIEVEYRSLVQRIRTGQPDCSLILCSVLPVNPTVQNLLISNEQVVELNLRLRKIASEFALPFVDISSQLVDSQGSLARKFTEDGVHLNGGGYLVWREILEPFLKN